MNELLFAAFAPSRMDPELSIGRKFVRLLKAFDLGKSVRDRRVAIKMHLGGGSGFSTVHPFFVRKLVTALREAGARDIFITDLLPNVASAVERGYTEEVTGCRIIPVCGESGDEIVSFPVTPAFRTLDRIDLSRPILEADVVVNLAHIKGHGVCGFGGASKNFSMGAVNDAMRRKLHGLEGGLVWREEACVFCGKCVANCPNGAMTLKDRKLSVFFHNCKFCQHCALVCPQHAIEISDNCYGDFQRGMAMTSAKLLEHFTPDRALFFSFLMDVTLFCDCWGMTTPRLIPDIGILAGRDIVAMEQAALDLVDREELIERALPPGWMVDPGRSKHLFERLHHKDPRLVVRFLEELGAGTPDYTLREIE